MKLRYLLSAAIASVSILSCNDGSQDQASEVDAYNAGSQEVHVVVSAPLGLSGREQRLWMCKGKQVLSGTRTDGYSISIGKGVGRFTSLSSQTTSNRGISGSNLTPVGELKVINKIPGTCGEGMLSRCIHLGGVERGVNDNTHRREIYIHGTPTSNYSRLGKSASHGCIRMGQNDVKVVYNNVRVGTRVYVNSVNAVPHGNPCAFIGDHNGRAR